jgi:metacaspase-1
MAQGLSLHLGLNAVDPKHYQGWSGPLNACEADANDMRAIASTMHFKPTTLLTKKATRGAWEASMKAAAAKLNSGDIFLLTYSGHGGQLPDLNSDEDDGLDETWCLYDGELVDDELYAALSKFAAGVRIFVLSDSCHSGTVLKMRKMNEAQTYRSAAPAIRAMPDEYVQRVYLAHKKFYDKILTDKTLKKTAESVKGSAILISGCMDNQLSADGAFNGLFTGMLKTVWNNGKFSGDYKSFWKTIVKKMPPDQTPNFFPVGAASAKFQGQKPFTV